MPAPSVQSQRLLILQSFRETSWAGSGPASAKWMGVKYGGVSFKPYRKSTVFDEARGSLRPGYVSALLRKGGEWKIPGYFSYEDSILLGASFLGSVAPTGGSPWIYSFTGPGSTQPTLATFTFEYNQASYVTQATGCVANKLSIKGNAMEHWEYELSGFSQDIDAGTTASITALGERTINPVLTANTTLYLDTLGSTGSTAYQGVLVDFALEMENNAKAIYTAGSLVPNQWVFGDKLKADLTLNLLNTASTRSYFTTNWLQNVICNVQLKATTGASTIAQINFSGVMTDDPDLYGEKDGAQAFKVKLSGMYNSTASQDLSMTITTTASVYP